MSGKGDSIRVSILAIEESLTFPIAGIYETLQIFGSLPASAGKRSFDVQIVGREPGTLQTEMGLPLTVHRTFDEVDESDIVIATSMATAESNEWLAGRHPEAVRWLCAMHERGAVLCSGCTGAFLLAETGLLDGLECTIHWAYAPAFRRDFPGVNVRPTDILVTAGGRREFVMAGATSSWQDLVLYLVTRYVGAEQAQALAKFMLFQWRTESQAPYVSFIPPTRHGDAMISRLQEWLGSNSTSPNPIDGMSRHFRVSESTLKRRFKHATGYSPLHYVQNLRIEEAKRRLETTDRPIDEISAEVGYEDPAFFRRLFKRTTCLTPGEYRRKFRIPEFARHA